MPHGLLTIKVHVSVMLHSTRNQDMFYMENSSLASYRSSLFYNGPELWNELADDICRFSPLDVFKLQIKILFKSRK